MKVTKVAVGSCESFSSNHVLTMDPDRSGFPFRE